MEPGRHRADDGEEERRPRTDRRRRVLGWVEEWEVDIAVVEESAMRARIQRTK